jgi:hypothetical protein
MRLSRADATCDEQPRYELASTPYCDGSIGVDGAVDMSATIVVDCRWDARGSAVSMKRAISSLATRARAVDDKGGAHVHSAVNDQV